MNRNFVLAFACILSGACSFAQSAAPPAQTLQTPAAIPDRRQMFNKASQDFAAERWQQAFNEFSELHQQFPSDAKISEFLAESALNIGNTQLAISLMEPIRKASPERWRASALLARAYAETGRDAERDAEIAYLQNLHDTKFAPGIARLQTILIERRVLPHGSVRIWYGLEPWGKFNTYLFARIYDAQGVEMGHVALDSSDFDQALWAKTHSQEAAAGKRVFFLDSYTQPQKNPNGTLTVTQALLAIYDGKPAYNTVRDKILVVAAGKTGSIAITTSVQPK